MTCGKSQEFLAKAKIKVKKQLSTREQTLGEKEALDLTVQIDVILASKGKKVVRINLRKDKPSREELLGVLLGPTGKLRAPTLRKGRTLIVGFSEDEYAKLFL